MVTVTISVGRGIWCGELCEADWDRFRSDVTRALDVYGHAKVHVSSALQAAGVWNNVRETSATWVADVPDDNIGRLQDELVRLAGVYDQDAIAFTEGTTTLLERVKPILRSAR